ncbi:MAG: 5-guanidino-2-oxopentanoate decarboxylase [Eubacteriaceae bacterium]|jgi:thiamine pyrophosphate-dependent acetolactate synthase large subunit-like protein|nr:5-guanidino-2-oxopentanoate decarboxylase [Eubacteriaceae bacterium]MDN5307552.1 5-guanidino-2-oxopentanoate decarboxylase [Eubacteriaceae bacterium]
MATKKISGAQLLVQTMEKIGVECAFGIPGVHNLKIYDALTKSSIRHITTRNESGAGFMADGYGRSTGRPGTAIVITGPGLTNILTPMGQAYLDAVPMVVISSQLPSTIINQSTGFLHELRNSTIVAGAVAKESRRVTSADQMAEIIRFAYQLAVSGRPGPVHVEVPLDILAEEVWVDEPGLNSLTQCLPVYEETLKKAAALINLARRVTIVTGGGAVNAAIEVTALSQKIKAAVVSTCAGKGVVSEKSPLHLGARLPYKEVRQYVEESDLVLALGTQLSPTDLWENKLKLKGQLLQFDIDSDAFYRNYPADLGVKGDCKELIKNLLPLIEEKYKQAEELVQSIKTAAIKTGPVVTGNNKSFDLALEVLEVFRESLGDEEILLADMTTAAYIALSEYEAYAPRTFLHPVGFGTLGYSVPAAIGAKIANPDKNMIALIGDGGFQFTMQELAVACEQNLPIPIVIWNNGGYGEIKRNEAAMGFENYIAVDNKNPDFIKLAQAYEIDGLRPKNQQELKQALTESFKKDQPTIIEINVNDWQRAA